MARRINLHCAFCTSLLLLAACGEDNAAETGAASARDLEVTMNALENPIISCQIQAGECVQKASDLTALQACQAGIGDCLKVVGERVQKVADGVVACRDEERKCLRAQGASCFSDFETCVQALDSARGPGQPGFPSIDGGAPSFPGLGDGGLPGFPTPPWLDDDGGRSGLPTPPFPAHDAGLPGFPTPIPNLDDAGRPGVPSFPGLGDGGLSGLPPFGGLPQLPGNECLAGLRECAAKPAADLFACAGDARECLLGAAPLALPFP